MIHGQPLLESASPTRRGENGGGGETAEGRSTRTNQGTERTTHRAAKTKTTKRRRGETKAVKQERGQRTEAGWTDRGPEGEREKKR